MRLQASSRRGWTYFALVFSFCLTAVPSLLAQVPPTITVQPQDAIICNGEAAEFFVEAEGTPPLRYQWRRDGLSIFGATDSVYRIESVGPDADNHEYDVIVSNDSGQDVSDPALLTVLVQEQPLFTTDLPSSLSACLGDSVTLTVETDPSDVDYRWYRNETPIFGVVGNTYQIDNVGTDAEGVYRVVAYNDCFETSSTALTLSVVTVDPPIITTDLPSQLEVCVEAPITVTVAADQPEATFQWLHDGNPIPGATAASYAISSAAASDAGDYSVVVSNACHDVTSSTANLDVLMYYTPVFTTNLPGSLDVCLGDPLELTVAVNRPDTEFRWYFNGALIPGVTGPTLSIPAVTVDDDGLYIVEAVNPCRTATSSPTMLTVLVMPPPNITVNLPSHVAVCAGESTTLTVTVSQTNVTYQWYRDGEIIPNATSASYMIEEADESDEAAYTVVVSNTCHDVTSVAANVDVLFLDPPTLTMDLPSSVAQCEGEPVTLSVTANQTGLTYHWYHDGALIPGATGKTYTIPAMHAADAGAYYVLVANACKETASTEANVILKVGPTITTQPAVPATHLCIGEPLNLAITASGTATLHFQWYKDNEMIDGATAPVFDIQNVTDADSGTYHIVVTNDCDEAVSNPVPVVVDTAVSIVEQPDNAAIAIGQKHAFTVTVAGSAPFEYQWFYNEQEIPSANEATYDADKAGNYHCRIRNFCGEVFSAQVALFTAAPMQVYAQADAYNLKPGQASKLTVQVLSGGIVPFSYRWNNGATTKSITVQPGKETTYTCTVTDGIGQTASASVTISIAQTPSDDQGGQDQPPDDQNGNDNNNNNNDNNNNGDNNNDDNNQDQPGAGLCPLTGFGMIGMLMAGLCWTRSRAPRRR